MCFTFFTLAARIAAHFPSNTTTLCLQNQRFQHLRISVRVKTSINSHVIRPKIDQNYIAYDTTVVLMVIIMFIVHVSMVDDNMKTRSHEEK